MRRKARRERIRRAYVEPVSLALRRRRDEDRCRICGEPVGFTRQPPHPSAATIDHVIALSRGGELAPYRGTTDTPFDALSLAGVRIGAIRTPHDQSTRTSLHLPVSLKGSGILRFFQTTTGAPRSRELPLTSRYSPLFTSWIT
jgi:hypothetical protein